jgi:hypothetical protein
VTTDAATATADQEPAADYGATLSPAAGARRERGRPRQRWAPKLPVGILVGAFALSRVIAAAAGVRYDDSPLAGRANTDMWQLLDVRLLRSDLIQSVSPVRSRWDW